MERERGREGERPVSYSKLKKDSMFSRQTERTKY
jgi:hypothetical protein